MTKQTLQTESDGEKGEGVETKRKNFFLSQGKYMRRTTNITFPSSPLLQIVVVVVAAAVVGGVADCCWWCCRLLLETNKAKIWGKLVQ